MPPILPIALSLLGLGLPALAQTTQPVLTGDVRIHDPSIVEVNGEFIAFATGFEGGVDQGAIRLKTSPDGIDWTDRGGLGKGLPDWVRPTLGGLKPPNIWAPSVSEHEGRHYLYYSVSIFGMNVSAIGLMTNDDLDPADPEAGWQDHGPVVLSKYQDNFNAIDAFRIDTSDGKAWLSYGSYWDGIRMVELDPGSGLPLEGAEAIRLASRGGAGVEASAILEHEGKFYLFVSFDQCCEGIESTYRIMVGRADAVTGPYLDRDGTPMLEGGGTQLLATTGRFIGPGGQEPVETGGGPMLTYHYYDGDDLGVAKLALTPLRFDEEGWPVLDPLPDGP